MEQCTISDFIKDFWKSKRKNSVKKVAVDSEDMLIFNVATGNMPNFRAHAYVSALRSEFQSKFLTGKRDVKSLWFSKPDNSTGSDVKKLSVKKDEILVFTIETGNMPNSKVQQYLSKLSSGFRGKILVDGEPVQSIWIARPKNEEVTSVKKLSEGEKEAIFANERTKIKRKLTKELKDIKVSTKAEEQIKSLIKEL